MNWRKLILRCELSPGDMVMLTAAVRDLHRCNPDVFLTDVRTRCPDLWEHNPFITPIADDDPDAEVIDCNYPLIDHSNRLPYHCLHGFMQMLAKRLSIRIEPTEFRGFVPIAPVEKTWMSQVHELTGEDTPFWVIVAGGKYDVPVKWWDADRFQRVVDHFRGRIQFVQVGRAGHYHPALDGVIDLRGKTNLRQLTRLIYHAQGVVCGVTAAMHLAAAVETKPGLPRRRACVVIAGGREPAHWEEYPGHQFIHTVGALPCCATGGCWKARVFPLEDGDTRDQSLCTTVSGELPRCMDMINAQEVINRIKLYFDGGALKYLTPTQAAAAEVGVVKAKAQPVSELTVFTARQRMEQFARSIPAAAPKTEGRGIVIPAGGPRYLPSAWVCISMLRRLGCRLPIQLWHLGPEEVDEDFARLVGDMGVTCVDGLKVRERQPARLLKGWELKPYAMLHSGFREVLLLDADNVPVVNPEHLFDTAEFRETGAVFWPDYGRLAPERSIWQLCGVTYRDEPEFESGQALVDVVRCHRAMRLTMWMNEHSDFFYRHIHGDKDTFHFGFHKTQTRYAMPAAPIHKLPGVMCQHNFQGERVFQHRNGHKWSLEKPNPRIPGFLLEEECLQALDTLRALLAAGTDGPPLDADVKPDDGVAPAETTEEPSVRSQSQ